MTENSSFALKPLSSHASPLPANSLKINVGNLANKPPLGSGTLSLKSTITWHWCKITSHNLWKWRRNPICILGIFQTLTWSLKTWRSRSHRKSESESCLFLLKAVKLTTRSPPIQQCFRAGLRLWVPAKPCRPHPRLSLAIKDLKHGTSCKPLDSVHNETELGKSSSRLKHQ